MPENRIDWSRLDRRRRRPRTSLRKLLILTVLLVIALLVGFAAILLLCRWEVTGFPESPATHLQNHPPSSSCVSSYRAQMWFTSSSVALEKASLASALFCLPRWLRPIM